MPTTFPSLQIEVAPAYELLMTLAVMSDTPGRPAYELDDSWFSSVRQRASPDLIERIERLSGSDRLWAHMLTLAYEAPPPRDVPIVLAHVAATDAAELRLRLLGYYVRSLRRVTSPEVIAAAAAGDEAAQREFLRTSDPEDEGWQRVLRAVLPLDAGETKTLVLGIMRDWYEQVFRAQEAGVMPVLERDAERKQAMARTHAPEVVLADCLPGYEYVPQPGIHSLLLISSVVIRPQLYIFDHGDTRIFAHGVSDESLSADSGAPSPRLLRLAKAIGDERRLRILKHLTAGDRTLHELALDFGVSDTTMLHHLIILRAAGLVRVQAGAGKRYRLERHALREMGELLGEYLLPGQDYRLK